MKILNASGTFTSRTYLLGAGLACFFTGCAEKSSTSDQTVDPQPAAVVDSQPEVKPEPSEATATGPDTVVATVAGRPILQREVDERLATYYGQYLSSLPKDSAAELVKRASAAIINDLISRALLLQAAQAAKISIAEEAFEKQWKEFTASLPKGTSLEDYLTRTGFSEDAMRATIADEMRIRVLIEEKTANIPDASEEEVAAYYRDNTKEFSADESVTARHILYSTKGETDEAVIEAKREQAEKTRIRLIESEEDIFATVAKEESEGPSAVNGGSLGTFSRGQMVKPFEEAAFSLEPGGISEIVKTQFGFHIIQVSEKSVGTVLPVSDVRADIAKNLLADKRNAAVTSYIKELEKKTIVLRR
jgi:peptidyl-prolyl cis-trans isomerase C